MQLYYLKPPEMESIFGLEGGVQPFPGYITAPLYHKNAKEKKIVTFIRVQRDWLFIDLVFPSQAA